MLNGLVDELKGLLPNGILTVEGVDALGIGKTKVVDQVVLTPFLPPYTCPFVGFTDEPYPVPLDEEDLAGDVVLPDAFDGWRLPLLAECRLVNLAFYFMVILEVLLVQPYTAQEVLL